jgi:FkbM family methyltransferase
MITQVYQPRRTLRAVLADRLAERHSFAGMRGWAWSLYDRALHRRLGARLPCRGDVRTVYLRGHDRPFFLRLGTSDWLVLKEIFMDGEYQELARVDPRSVHTVVDLGANVGLSVRLWQTMFPGSTIIAVEPDAENMAICRLNADGPLSPQPIFETCCIAGARRKVALDHSTSEWAYKMCDADGSAATIDALTIPDILARAGIDGPIDLLKCDIEGAEAELFASAAPWIDRVGTMIVELHAPYTHAEFRADLARAASSPWNCRVLSASEDLAVVLAQRVV